MTIIEVQQIGKFITTLYNIEETLTPTELQIAQDALHDPILETTTPNHHAEWYITIAFKPGVTDNLGNTASIALQDALKKDINVRSAKRHSFNGTKEQAEHEASKLANPLIETINISNMKEVTFAQNEVSTNNTIETINLDVSDAELLQLSKHRILALNLQEMKAITNFSKTITDAELECIAQTWSEHCKHKIFNAKITYTEFNAIEVIDSIYKKYIIKSTNEVNSPWLVSVFKDNAGIIEFTENYNITAKVETHNSPSALDPYGGALTGIVGVNRDPLGTGTGSRLIANTNVFCFAPPNYSQPLPPRLLHPKRIYEGVRQGVEHGGNKSGIPTVNGAIVFDERYLGKPLVYCGTIGIMPKTINGVPTHTKNINNGDLIVLAGGRTGNDGIHGATFSSEELHEDSPTSAVQIGDPFTQKKLHDFLLEAQQQNFYRTLTDNGAGGLSSSVGELAQISNGAHLTLEKVPLKYQGLQPWQILLSESQERMTVVVPPEQRENLQRIANKHEVEIAVIGTFTNTGNFIATYENQPVMNIPLAFLHAAPQLELEAEWTPPMIEEQDMEEQEDYTKDLLALLSRYNIRSKEHVIRQYDHEVQAQSIIKPLTGHDGPSDAALLQPLETQQQNKCGIIISNGIYPRYSDIDTYHMAACAIDEAIRNAVATGANPDSIALLDNFCWPDPIQSKTTLDGRYKLAQLVRANKALYTYAVAYNTPFISGKDSMKNDYRIGDIKISIPPTLLITAIGRINDIEKGMTTDFKAAGDRVYIVGLTKNEMGASEYFAMHDLTSSNVPRVDAKIAKEIYAAIHYTIEHNLIESCHDCSDGGLAVSIIESCIGGNVGVDIDIRNIPTDCEKIYQTLFSESQSRFIVSVAPENKEVFEAAMKNIEMKHIGIVTEHEILFHNEDPIIHSTVQQTKEAWQCHHLS